MAQQGHPQASGGKAAAADTADGPTGLDMAKETDRLNTESAYLEAQLRNAELRKRAAHLNRHEL